MGYLECLVSDLLKVSGLSPTRVHEIVQESRFRYLLENDPAVKALIRDAFRLAQHRANEERNRGIG